MTARHRRRIGVEYNPYVIGGTETFLAALFSHLDPARFTPVAVASSAGRWQRFLDGRAESHVVPYRDEDGAPADIAGALRRLDLDLVQSSYFSPALAYAAAKAGLPHVWRLGGHVDALHRDWTGREKAQLLSLVCMLSRRIVCNSRYIRSQFRTPDDRERVDVIRNGFDPRGLPHGARQTGVSPPRIAMVAHLVPQKRHLVFLHAAASIAAKVPQAQFFIFGGSHGVPELRPYEASLLSVAQDLGIDRNLEIRELRSDRFEAMREIDIFAAPGVNEGASNAVVEAMALAKPVVAAASGGNTELIEDGVTGRLVPPEDARALARSILELIEDPALRISLGRAASEHVARTLNMRACARRYEDIYDEVLTAQR